MCRQSQSASRKSSNSPLSNNGDRQLTTLFISDLHLEPARPDITAQLLSFLAGEARDAEALYILGDLFEAWVGDDDDDPFVSEVGAALRSVSDSGVSCYFAHGNRDFLVGHTYAAQAGFDLLSDWTVLELAGEFVLVGHGDDLCTDDTEYMAFRRVVREPQWQQNILKLPLAQRRQLVASARKKSRMNTAGKAMDIMDVNDSAVAQLLRSHGVNQLLHGHTHRPAIHELSIDGQDATRIVLGDWYDHGSIVRWDDAGYRLEQLAR
jgi:UDP-2,3-diacylglucosamine hydrolase